MSRIIAGSRGGGGSRHRRATVRVRPPIAYARRCSRRSPPGRAPRLHRLSDPLAGMAFCDLYAGSGAVGLEAASRGARPSAVGGAGPAYGLSSPKRNAKALALAVDVVISSVEQVLRQPTGSAIRHRLR